MNKFLSSILLLLFLISGCNTIPKKALQLSSESLKFRQMQTRKYETNDESKILSSGASLMQDMGYVINEIETELGVLVGSKVRDASDAAQTILILALSALAGTPATFDKEQMLRMALVTNPVNKKEIAVRVTFQRIVFNNQGQISAREPIIDEKVYKEFFNKLSKSVFLEAHEI